MTRPAAADAPPASHGSGETRTAGRDPSAPPLSRRTERRTGPADPPERELPAWFVAGLVAAVVFVATAGIVGLAFLTFGGYRAAITGALAGIAAVAVAVPAARTLGPRRRPDHGAAVAAVAVAVAFFALAGAFHAEHLLQDRDPAVYLDAGRSIARTHQYAPTEHFGPFSDPAFNGGKRGYRPDFFPMLPVELALGWSAGGDTGLLLVAPLLGALGLLAAYALAARVLGTRAALLALAVLAIVPLQLWFARDAYSELVVQVVVLAGLWLYLEARARAQWGLGLIAGFVVASSYLARIDALTVLVSAFLIVAVDWARCDADARPAAARRVVLAFTAGLVACNLYAQVVTRSLSRPYLSRLSSQQHQLLAVVVAAFAVFVGVVLLHRSRPDLLRRLAPNRAVMVVATAAATALFVWGYVWRPEPARDLPVVMPGTVLTAALRARINAWHASRSLHWFASYYGLPALVVAFAGVVLLAVWARGGNRAATVTLFVTLPVALLYVARPSIATDQPWVMRRYLPVVVPGVAIAIAAGARAGWLAARAVHAPRARRLALVLVAGGVLAVLVPAVAAARPFVTARRQHGALGAVHGVCRAAGHDGAVLVWGAHYLDVELPRPIIDFCGVPAGRSSTDDLAGLARQWKQQGRRLFVATAFPDAARQHAPGAVVVAHEVVDDAGDPERVFDRAPRRADPDRQDIWVLYVPAP